MNRIISNRTQNIFINIAVLLTVLIGVENIVIGYYYQLKILMDIDNYYEFVNPKTLQFHRTLSIIIGFVLIFISYRLFKRMRMAWIISISMMSVLTFMDMRKLGSIFEPITLVQIAVIIILVANYKNFKKEIGRAHV